LDALLEEIGRQPDLQLRVQDDPMADSDEHIATVTGFDGGVWHVVANREEARTNRPVRTLVYAYQKRATLQRTALPDIDQIWDYHPTGAAIIAFRAYQPEDIMQAAVTGDFLPPGVSRHIVHGRAIRVNYPMVDLRDAYTPLERKNESLRRWVQDRISARRVRFYAESTFQFDE
jgi:hypothetical protein